MKSKLFLQIIRITRNYFNKKYLQHCILYSNILRTMNKQVCYFFNFVIILNIILLLLVKPNIFPLLF